MSYRYGDIVAPYLVVNEPLRVEDEHFLDCVQTGMRPLTDGANGLAVVEVLEAAQRSMREGVAVRLRSHPRRPSSVTVPRQAVAERQRAR
jgi:predicted dehydrogenase